MISILRNSVFVFFIIVLTSCDFDDNKKFTNYELLNTGDIIFHQSKSRQSKAIELATGSIYTHCGLLYVFEKEYFIFEAVGPVKLTPIDEWISRGLNSHFVVKRLKNYNLSDIQIDNLVNASKYYESKHYDSKFEWSEDRIYCSELVWKVYKQALDLELCKLRKPAHFELDKPEIRDIIKKRFENNLNKDEILLSPGNIFESELLKTVCTSSK